MSRYNTALAALTKTAGFNLKGMAKAVGSQITKPKGFALTRQGMGSGPLTNNPLTFANKAMFTAFPAGALAAGANTLPEDSVGMTAIRNAENSEAVSPQEILGFKIRRLGRQMMPKQQQLDKEYQARLKKIAGLSLKGMAKAVGRPMTAAGGAVAKGVGNTVRQGVLGARRAQRAVTPTMAGAAGAGVGAAGAAGAWKGQQDEQTAEINAQNAQPLPPHIKRLLLALRQQKTAGHR